jgi:glycosyltransferase involved in cell wall biosynthesis
MPVVYRLADVFVLPSKGPGETWGLSVNEAMACAKPVIVSDKCGCAADLVHENGFVFSAMNQRELETIIRYFAAHQTEINSMGKKSFSHIASYSFTKIAEAIESVT